MEGEWDWATLTRRPMDIGRIGLFDLQSLIADTSLRVSGIYNVVLG